LFTTEPSQIDAVQILRKRKV